MSHTLSNTSQQAFDRVLEEFHSTPRAISYERLGRMLVAMYRHQTHPSRMFHLIAQMAEKGAVRDNPDIELLALIAWAVAESGPEFLFATKGDVS